MSETAHPAAGKIVWFETPAIDVGRAQAFYGDLFGWQFQAWDGPAEYHMTYDGGGAIQPADGERGILVYFSSVDIDASIVRVRELGGTASEAEEIPGVGRYSHCTDSEGNRFGLFQPSEGS